MCTRSRSRTRNTPGLSRRPLPLGYPGMCGVTRYRTAHAELARQRCAPAPTPSRAATRVRTGDLALTRRTLYRLSYSGVELGAQSEVSTPSCSGGPRHRRGTRRVRPVRPRRHVVGNQGVEPRASCTQSRSGHRAGRSRSPDRRTAGRASHMPSTVEVSSHGPAGRGQGRVGRRRMPHPESSSEIQKGRRPGLPGWRPAVVPLVVYPVPALLSRRMASEGRSDMTRAHASTPRGDCRRGFGLVWRNMSAGLLVAWCCVLPR